MLSRGETAPGRTLRAQGLWAAAGWLPSRRERTTPDSRSTAVFLLKIPEISTESGEILH